MNCGRVRSAPGEAPNRSVTPGRLSPLVSARSTYTPALRTEIGTVTTYDSASPSPFVSSFSEATGEEIVRSAGCSWNARQSYAGVEWDHWYTRPTMSGDAGRSKALSLGSRINVRRTVYVPLTWAFRTSGAQKPIPKTSHPPSISTRPLVGARPAPVAGSERMPTAV